MRNLNVQNMSSMGKKELDVQERANHLEREELNVPHLEGQLKGREVNAHEQFGQVKRRKKLERSLPGRESY